MKLPWQEYMKSYRSGRLGEEFCRYHFGISEPRYEIKSSGSRSNAVIIQVWQLLQQLDKQYVIVSYERATRKVTRGERKGRTTYVETIEEAYQKKVKVAVIRGDQIERIAIDEKLWMTSTARGGDIMLYGKWGIVIRVPKRCLPFHDDYIVEDTEEYSLHAQPGCTPNWKIDMTAESIEGSLFAARPGDAEPPPEDTEDIMPF